MIGKRQIKWGIACIALCMTTSAAGQKLLAPEEGIYHGAMPDFPYQGLQATYTDRLNEFQTISGKDLAFALVDNHWLEQISFPSREVAAIHAQDIIPLVSIMPWSRAQRFVGPDPIFSLDRFLSGRYDGNLRAWARAARATGKPMMVEFAPEPNGNWFPWSGVFNGADRTLLYGDPTLADGPEKYRDVHRRIVDIFREEGANNVTWVFHVVNGNKPEAEWNTMAAYYPGDMYIDWIGTSVYSAQEIGDVWEPFEATMDEAYQELTNISLNKPLAILEWGILEDWDQPFRKADWITEAFASLKNGRYDRIKAINYWHERPWSTRGLNDMRIDSSENSLRAYRTEVADPLFVVEPVFDADLPDSSAEKCKCGVFNNQYGQGCSVVRPQSQIDAGRSKFLVQSSGTSSCATEQACVTNYGNYLNDTNYWCPNGWVLKNEAN